MIHLIPVGDSYYTTASLTLEDKYAPGALLHDNHQPAADGLQNDIPLLGERRTLAKRQIAAERDRSHKRRCPC